ncbi:MAG: hypothetical protein WBP44_06640 [Gammaproteobacteria bacterium]
MSLLSRLVIVFIVIFNLSGCGGGGSSSDSDSSSPNSGGSGSGGGGSGSGGDVSSGLLFSPDGATLAYVADQNLNDVFELFVVELSNPGVTTRINRNPASGGDVLTDRYRFSPASDALAYVADEDSNDINEFYLVELASPAVSIKLNSPLTAGGNVSAAELEISSDGERLVYLADQDVDEDYELYRVDLETPGSSVKVSPLLPPGGDVVTFTLIPQAHF